MPSRRLVTSATSVIAYSAASSWNASCGRARHLVAGQLNLFTHAEECRAHAPDCTCAERSWSNTLPGRGVESPLKADGDVQLGVCRAACRRHLAVQVVDGHMRQRAVVAVDAAHDLVHHAAQPLRAHRPPFHALPLRSPSHGSL